MTGLGDKFIEMLHGTSSDGPGRQMNRNASWPIDKDTSDRPVRQKNRNATWPAEKGGHHQ